MSENKEQCVRCGQAREHMAPTPWRASVSLMCEPCHTARKAEARKAAFDKLGGEKPDTDRQEDLLCPYCGTSYWADGIYETTEGLECDTCEGEFNVEVETVLYFTTLKAL